MGASYVNIIRRMVQFYWSQNLDNLPSSLRLARPKYETTVEAVLDKDGTLVELQLKQNSGSPPIDEAVLQAFRLASPFPAPPVQLVASDGQVYLPTMTFEVNVGRARSPYVGVDPRQGVQFPGILKTPR
jgi:TonB family protein